MKKRLMGFVLALIVLTTAVIPQTTVLASASTTIDTFALDEILVIAKAIPNNGYTTASWIYLQSAIGLAEHNMAVSGVTQAEIDTDYENIKTAVRQLELIPTPSQWSDNVGIKDYTVGYSHVVVVKNDGTLWAWGRNSFMELGDGTTVNRNAPVQIGTDTNWLRVSAGVTHTLAIKTDGSLWAWGSNDYGQLGDGTFIDKAYPVRIGTANNWVDISAGAYHSLARNSSTIFAWGQNNYGQVGDGTTNNRSIPVSITAPGTNVRSMSAGRSHSLVVDNNGFRFSWGRNNRGQLGNGSANSTLTTIPTRFPPVSGEMLWSSAKAGWDFSLSIAVAGQTYGWGENDLNKYRTDGTTTFYTNPMPLLGPTVVSFSPGVNGTTMIQNGRINYIGSVGVTSYNQWRQVGTDNDWANIETGNNFSLAKKTDGSLWAFGSNNFGQIGDGTNTNRTSPVKIWGAPIVPIVDTSVLQALINQAEALNGDDYTSESWVILQNALVSAKALMNNPNKTQIDVDIECIDMKIALKRLVYIGDLKALIADAILKRNDTYNYTKGSRDILQDAIDDAEMFLTGTGITREQVEYEIEKLQEEINKLVFVGDLRDLITLVVDTFSPFIPNPEIYVPLVYADGLVTWNHNATQKQVDDAYDDLLNAFNAFINPPVDTSALEELIALAKAIINDNYTSVSWDILQNAISAAESLIANPNKTQTEVDTEYANLQAAINQLEEEETMKTVWVNDDDPRINMVGGWWVNDESVPDAYMGDQSVAYQMGQYAEFTFIGESATIIATTSNNLGYMDVYINDIFNTSLNLYSPSLTAQAEFELNNITAGLNTIKIVYTGEKHADSSGFYITLDAIKYVGIEDDGTGGNDDGSWVNDSDVDIINNFDYANIQYNGSWLPDSTNNQHVTNQAGAFAEFTFTGTNIAVVGATAPNLGKMDVFINGNFIKNVDLYSPTTNFNEILFAVSDLSAGINEIKIVHSGTKSPLSSDSWITLNSFVYK